MLPSERKAHEHFVSVLRTFMMDSSLSDDAVYEILKATTMVRSDLIKLLNESGLYSPGKVAELIQQLDGMTFQHFDKALKEIADGLQSSYLYGVETMGEMIGAFEVGYPFGVAVMDAQLQAMTMYNTFAKIQMVTEEMRGLISAGVQQGVMLNQRPFEVMQYITHVVGIRDIAGFREVGTTGVSAKAERVVRTEMMTAQNMGFWDSLKQAGEKDQDLHKAWMATGDNRTRDEHLEAHGQTRRWDEDFVVGGETCVGPHDPSLSPRNRINCRCRSVPYKKEWGPLEELTGLIDEQVAIEKARRADPQARPKEMKPLKPNDKLWAPRPWDEGMAGSKAAWAYQDQVEAYKQGIPRNLMNRPDDGIFTEFTPDYVVEQKMTIAAELAEGLGINDEVTGEFVRLWAATSNQGLASLQIQQAIADKFGIELSGWQQQELARLTAKREAVLRSGRNFVNDPALRKFGEMSGGNYQVWLTSTGMDTDTAVRAMIDQMYENTQHRLAQAGIEEYVLWRGTEISDELAEMFGSRLTRGGIIDLVQNSAGSWSLDPDTAATFMSWSHQPGMRPIMIEARIPRERILSTARTGFGCLNEWEFVVVGGHTGDLVMVAQVGP